MANDGSHSANDDLDLSADNDIVDSDLKAFRRIFDFNDHSAHYRMMMGISMTGVADDPVVVPIAEVAA